MAPHDLIFIVGVLVFGLLEVTTSIVTSLRDGSTSEGLEGSAQPMAFRR